MGSIRAGLVLMKVGHHTLAGSRQGLVLRQAGRMGSIGAGLVLMKVGSHTQAGSRQGLVLRQEHGLKDPGLLVVK
jgi:hypothetical protein